MEKEILYKQGVIMIFIAECGINHNGDYQRAKLLAYEAKLAGADIAKFQTFPDGWNDLKNISYPDTARLAHYCDELGIEFMSTPHSLSAVDFLEPLVKTYKIASPFLTDLDFVKHVASKKKFVYFGTGSLIHDNGMATDEEIDDAFKILMTSGCYPLAMHCVSKYPAENPHYERIDVIRKRHAMCGYSSHTPHVLPPDNVPVCEYHFKIDDDCVDANVSLNPLEFKDMVRSVNEKV